jgi:hypothetical protein
MWTILTQPGLTNVIVDFTGALSPLLEGLLGVLALSAGMLVTLALREHRAQTSPSVAEPTPVEEPEYRKAA